MIGSGTQMSGLDVEGENWGETECKLGVWCSNPSVHDAALTVEMDWKDKSQF